MKSVQIRIFFSSLFSNINGEEIEATITAANIGTAVCKTKSHKQQAVKKKNVSNRELWGVCYQEWALNDFTQQLWMQKKTFGLILKIIRTFLEKKATNLNSNLMTPDQHLGLPNISNRLWYSLHNLVANIWSINTGSKWKL